MSGGSWHVISFLPAASRIFESDLETGMKSGKHFERNPYPCPDSILFRVMLVFVTSLSLILLTIF